MLTFIQYLLVYCETFKHPFQCFGFFTEKKIDPGLVCLLCVVHGGKIIENSPEGTDERRKRREGRDIEGGK